MAKDRDGGVEIFRCLLMALIVVHHVCCHGLLEETGAAWILYVLTLPAVDGFVAISGWYGIKFSWMKVARLWALMAFYLLFTMGCVMVAQLCGWTDLRPRLHGWWFAGTYLGLMFVSPLINAALDVLAQQPKKLLSAVGLYAIAVCLNWAPSHLFTNVSVSGWTSHSFNTLLFVYVLAGTVRRLMPDFGQRYRRWLSIGLTTVCVLLLTYVSIRILTRDSIGVCSKLLNRFGYDSPLTLGLAMGAFLWFQASRPARWLAKLCAFLGPSMFGIYLIHEAPIGRGLYRLPQKWMSAYMPELPDWTILLTSAILTFSICLAIDLCRRGALRILLPIGGALFAKKKG